MPPQRARWRSLLFVPGDNISLLDKAPKRPADGLIFDLEDSVPEDRKDLARANLGAFAGRLADGGADLLVRVNNHPAQLELDIAVLPIGTRAILLPKTETVEDLIAVHGRLSEREVRLGLTPGAIGILTLIESPAAIFELRAIAQAPRVIGRALGPEDLSLAMGTAPSPTLLTVPAQLICLAAAAGDLMAFAVPSSISAFRDAEGWASAVATAKAFGATGGLCIHPSQIEAVNAAFSPSAREIAWAEEVLGAWARAETSGLGVSAVDGSMIDRPVVERARALIRRRLPSPSE